MQHMTCTHGVDVLIHLCTNDWSLPQVLHITDTLRVFPLLWCLMLCARCCDDKGMDTTHRGETSVRQVMCPVHFVFLNLLAQTSVRALLSVFAIWRVNLLPLIDCKCGNCWWHCGRLLWQEMLWCLISCCVVWWSLPCGRPWRDILSMLLHSYMSERGICEAPFISEA